MVQLMVKVRRIHDRFLANCQFFEPCVRKRWPQRTGIQVKQDDDGVRRNHEVHQYRRDIDQMLDRRHRHAGPRTNMNVPVLQDVHVPEQRRLVQQAMHQIEM